MARRYPGLFNLMCIVILISGVASQNQVTVSENVKDVFLFTQNFSLAGSNCNVERIEDTKRNSRVDVNLTEPVLNLAGQYSVDITLVKTLDREEGGLAYLVLRVFFSCGGGPLQQRDLPQLTIIISDVKDAVPQFLEDRYEATIPENQPVNSTILFNITADDDDIGDDIEYFVELSEKDIDMFTGVTIIKEINGLNRKVLDIQLLRQLDYERTTRFTFTLTARDTTNSSSTCDVIIRVKDIQDNPPVFSLPIYSGRVDEMAPLGTSVIAVSAVDGDGLDVRNQVVYSIVEGPASVFTVDNETGVVSVTGQLDIDGDNPVGVNGLVILTVLAQELNTSGEVQYGDSTERTTVQIQINDANDHPPVFGSKTYSGSIRGDAVVGEIVSIEGGGYVSVTDKDVAPNNNQFRLHVERDGKPWTVFEPNVKSQFVQASVLIMLRQPEYLDGLQNTHIKFQLIATSNKSRQGSNVTSSIADFLVFVLPRTTPAPPQQAVVDIPLSESDVIVFIMGFLLLLNIILTVALCWILRRNNGKGDLGFFRRGSKYYVSERKTNENSGVRRLDNLAERRNNDIELENPKVASLSTSAPKSGTGSSLTITQAATNRNTDVRNTVASATNRNRCDVTLLKEVESGTENSTDSPSLTETPNQVDSSRRCDVTPLRTEQPRDRSESRTLQTNSGDQQTTTNNLADSESGKNKCDVIPLEASLASKSKALSNLLERVHQKLAPGVKGQGQACDLRPLHEEHSSAEASFTDVTNSNNSSFSERTKCDVSPLIETSQKPMTDKQPKPHRNDDTSVSQYIPTLSQSQSQITRTGVPPVALTLPLGGASTKSRNEENTLGLTVTNPVYKEEATLKARQGNRPAEVARVTQVASNSQDRKVNSPKTVTINTNGKGIQRSSSQSTETGLPAKDYVQAAKSLLSSSSLNNLQNVDKEKTDVKVFK